VSRSLVQVFLRHDRACVGDSYWDANGNFKRSMLNEREGMCGWSMLGCGGDSRWGAMPERARGPVGHLLSAGIRCDVQGVCG
jgi:hypothetical protein